MLGAKFKSSVFWVCFILIMDLELCLCSAIIIPVLSSRLNLDDVYTLRSGAYWVVHVNLSDRGRFIGVAALKK